MGRKDGSVVHQLEGGAPNVGDTVTGAIDWERRHNLMRTHTALHVLCGVIWRDYGAQVTGGDMQPLAARMDFEFEHMTATFAEEVEELVNREVAEGRPISTRILPREEAMAIPDLIRTKINLLPEGIREVRVVEIEGLDLQADGGTHLSNTRDIGRIRIVGHESKGRINKRLRMTPTVEGNDPRTCNSGGIVYRAPMRSVRTSTKRLRERRLHGRDDLAGEELRLPHPLVRRAGRGAARTW